MSTEEPRWESWRWMRSGENPRVVARLAAGREMFLEPDGTPCCIGPELFCDERARTTLFNRDQSRVYFQTSGRHVALIGGRLFGPGHPGLWVAEMRWIGSWIS